MTETFSRLGSYHIVKNLHSRGTHSKVKLIMCVKSSNYYIAHIFKSQGFQIFFNKELEVLSLNLAPCVALIESSPEGTYTRKTGEEYSCMYFIVEYMVLGNLYDVTLNCRLDDESIRFFFKSILKAIKSLHIENICHRTIGLSNILFDEELNVKLSGLCYAENISNNNHTIVTTYNKYLPPEVTSQDTYQGDLSDCFSLGFILFYLKFKKAPFFYPNNGLDHYQKMFNTDKEKYWRCFDANNSVSSEFKKFIEKMIDPNPNNRKSLPEIEFDPWVLEDDLTTESTRKIIKDQIQGAMSAIPPQVDMQNHITSSFRDGMMDSCSIDFLKVKKLSDFKISKSNMIYTKSPPKELLSLVCQKIVNIGTSVEFSNEYFQFKARDNNYESPLYYKVTIYEQGSFNLVEARLIEGNEFDFYYLLNRIQKTIRNREEY